MTPDFKIQDAGPVSRLFLEKHTSTFQQAAKLISALPYGRNKTRNDLYAPLTENCGTCSSKHSILKKLADENAFNDLKLVVGIYKMNGRNTPATKNILQRHQLNFLPEAHCYLKYKDRIFDYTTTTSSALNFVNDLLEEIEINPEDVAEYKVKYHKEFLARWLKVNPHILIGLDEIWTIREKCIEALSGK
jgi:hypothetical protein